MSDWREGAVNSGRVVERPDSDVTFRRKKKVKRHPCKALECLICTLRYSFDDILCGVYNIETFVCSHCYAEMQQKPHAQSCFGKPTVILLNGKRDLGYDIKAKECRDVCVDRSMCQRIVRPDLQNV